MPSILRELPSTARYGDSAHLSSDLFCEKEAPMVNKTLFSGTKTERLRIDTCNERGDRAHLDEQPIVI